MKDIYNFVKRLAEINLRRSLNPHLTQWILIKLLEWFCIFTYQGQKGLKLFHLAALNIFFNTLKIMINLTKSLIFNIVFSLDTYNELQQMEIPATLVLDAAVG